MFRKTILAHTLTIAFAAAGTLAVSSSAFAASNSAGDIVGRAAAGTVITIENKSIGLSRTITVSTKGDYQMTQLPPGTYVVKAKRPDGSTEERQVVVNAGEGAAADFEAAANTVHVTGRASRIDVKSPESSMVLSEAVIDRIPVQRDVTAVALLAPGATRGDTRIGQTALRVGNVPSLGGASPAENVYYINGFNVTNMLNGVAFNQVPFEGIAQQQVKTGGYGPEYGRSLGGVLSVTTKRGTNEWHGGVNAVYLPKSLQASSVYGVRNEDTGRWSLAERPGGIDDLQANIWAGGPLIQDKLFVFGLVQAANIERTDTFNSVIEDQKSTTPRYLFKVDWNITDKNLLEVTAFSDKSKEKLTSYRQLTPYGGVRGENMGTDTYTNGGENFIGKWTSWVTDDLTVSALAGLGRYNRKSDLVNAVCPYIEDRRGAEIVNKGCWTSTQVIDPNANDERKAWRLDAEWNLGAHGLRFGVDNETYQVVDGSAISGGVRERVFTLAPGGRLSNGYVNNTGAAMDYIAARVFENGGTFTTKNSAYYLEDNWQVTKNVMASIGVRNESFENLNAEDKTFIKVKNTWAPRLGVSWDVQGNQQTKVYANAGRYYIPVMSNTNVRLSGAELDYTEFYAFNGTFGSDRFQRPGRGAQLGGRVVSSNGEAGDPRSVVDPNIKPMYQDEFIVGVQQALANRWTVGAKFTYRKLRSVMDDVCAYEGPRAWALANGFSEERADILGDTISHCFLFNPGGPLTANIDFDDGKGLTPVTIPAEALKFGKPERIFKALEFTFERSWDNVWTLQGSYVLAFNKGNTEGYVKSDIGQDDAGISQDWDFPGLMEGSYGYLPNDRRHSIKLFGSYQATPEWRLGANLLLQSGRPLNCLGFYNGNLDSDSIAYGASSFYCDGKRGNRGDRGNLGWTRDLGLQVTYQPKFWKGTTFQVDVLNVFNNRTVTSVTEEGEVAMHSPNPLYMRPLGIQSARQFRLMAQYEF